MSGLSQFHGSNKKQKQQQHNAELRLEQTSYKGPIPPSDELARYENIAPGLAQQIVDMAKKEQDARHISQSLIVGAETKAVKSEIRLKFIGQLTALTAVLSLVGLCAYGFYLGFGTQSAAIATVIVGVAGVFLYNKTSSNKEKDNN